MAQKDLKAIQGMADPDIFADEVFGFHAQQAVEKALKAWLSVVGLEYPRIHDLGELFELLSDRGQSIPGQFSALADLTDFAVQFRYESFDDLEGPFDRARTTQLISDLLRHVECLIG
jgi:HEPN domain-containing protein